MTFFCTLAAVLCLIAAVVSRKDFIRLVGCLLLAFLFSFPALGVIVRSMNIEPIPEQRLGD